MLIQLTTMCSEKCPHCMINALPNGKIMDLTTLEKSIWFASKSKAYTLIFSGGEITELPKFSLYIKYIVESINNFYGENKPNIIFLSNGTFVETEEKISTIKGIINYLKISNINFEFHITSFKEYYKSYDKIIKAVNDGIFGDIFGDSKYRLNITAPEDIFDLTLSNGLNSINTKLNWNNVNFIDSENLPLVSNGRGIKYLENDTNLDRKIPSPTCVTCKQFIRQIDKLGIDNFSDLIISLEKFNKVCKPYIKLNGDVILGETADCPSIGNIYNTNFISDIFNETSQDINTFKEFCLDKKLNLCVDCFNRNKNSNYNIIDNLINLK